MKAKTFLRAFLASSSLLAFSNSNATTYTWTKAVTATGSTDNWSTGTNWSASAPVSASNTTLVFGYSWTTNSTTATNTLTNNVANPFQLNVLTLGINTPTAGSGSLVGLINIAGSPLDFVSNGATTPQVNLSQNKSAGQNATFDTQAGVILDANTLFTGNGTATFTISGAISGAGTFTKSGTSTLSLSSASNSFSGGITVNGGTLAVTSTGTLGSNVNSNNIGIGAGAILTSAAAGNTGANQTITLTSTAGSLAVLGLGYNGLPAAAIAQADTNGGVIAPNAVTGYNTSLSTLLTGKNLFLGSIGTSTFTGAAGTVAAGNGSTYRLGGGGGQITFNTANLFTSSNNILVGSTATNGTGTVIISAAQNYTGTTTVSTGSTLQLGASLTGTTGGIIDNGALIINSSSNLTQATDLNGQVISGTGTLTKQGTGTLTLSDSNTYTGKTTIAPTAGPTAAGTLVVSSFDYITSGSYANHGLGSSLGAPTTVANGTIDLGAGFQANAALQYSGATATGETTDRVINLIFNGTGTTRNLNASGSGLLRFTSAFTSNASGSGSLVLTGSGSGQIDQGLPQLATGGLDKQSTGTWTLGGSGVFTGPTKITGGTLSLSSATALQNSPFNTASVAGDATNGLKIATTTLTLGGLTGTNPLDGLFTTALGGPGNTTAKGGYSGLTALTLNNASGTTSTFSGNIVDGASGMSLTKTGALSTQFLNGTNSYTGLTTVNGGTLGSSTGFSGAVSVTNGAALSPGASAGAFGTLAINSASSSALTLNNSNLLMDVSTASNDVIAVTGTTVLNGTNTLILNPTTGVANGTYTLTTYGAKSGSGSLVFANGTTTLGNATLAVNAGNIQMTVGAGGLNNCVWVGTSGAWDGGATNWNRNGAATQAFVNGDFVTIDDTGTTLTITSTGTVSPASVTVNNSSKAYTISATIGGSGTPLVKFGTNTLTLSGTNSYTGGTVINAGTVSFTADANLGDASGSITLNGGGLTLGANINFSMARNITVTGTGNSMRAGKNWSISTSGALTGSGAITFLDPSGSGGTPIYKFTSSGNTYTGAMTLPLSDVRVSSLGDTAGNNIVFTGASAFRLNDTGATAGLTFNNRAIELSNASATVDNLNTTHAFTIGSNLVATGAAAKVLTLSAAAGPANAFGGNITDGTGGGTVAVTKTGAGTWTLSGSNSYTGATTVSAGSLILSGSNTCTGATTISGGSLVLANTAAVASTSGITMNTASNSLVLKSDTAFTTLPNITGSTGAFTYSIVSDRATTGAALNQQLGTITMGNATFAFSNGGNVTSGTSVISFTSATMPSGATGTAVLNPTSANVNITGNVTSQSTDVARTLQLDGTSAGNTIGGTITQTVASALSISKTNTSTWTLSGNNTYSGTTGVSNGTLIMSGNNTLTGTITVSGSSGATLTLSGNNSSMTSNVTLSTAAAAVASSPMLIVNSATALGTGILNFGGGAATDVVRLDNTSAGALTVSTANPITMNRNFTFVGTQSLNLGTGAITLGGLTSGSNRIINVTANTLTLAGAISEATPGNNNGISKASAGTLVLSGTGNSYTGATNVSAGTLVGIGANAFGSTSGINVAAASTATLSLLGDSSTSFVKTSDSSPYPVTTTANGATINADQATIAGTSAKTMTIGALTLNTAVTNGTNFTGANNTSLAFGAVTTGNSASGTETITNNIIGGGSLTFASIAVNRTGTPTLAFAGNGNTTVTGAITQAATTALTKSGTGTLTLSGSCSYTGATTVSQGTLSLVGASLTSAVSVSSGASLGFTLGSPASNSSSVNLTSGTVKITGTPTLASYTLMTTSGIIGTPTLDAPIAGYALVVDGTTLKLNSTGPTSPYDTWAAGTFANPFTDTDPAHNPDGDTLTNLQEYAFGTDPTVSSTGPITWSGAAVTAHGTPVIIEESGNYYAVYGRRVDYVSAGLTYTQQFSADLTSAWYTDATAPIVIATDGVIDAVKIALPGLIPTDSGPQKARFFQVGVSQ